MKAAAFEACGGPEQIQVTEVPTPEPGPGEVLLEVAACGLNHLDLFSLAGPLDASRLPFWGGADVAGVVAELGEGVRRFRPGDRVVANPILDCGVCEHCLAGQESLCVSFGILGSTIPGGCAEYVAVREDRLLPVPDGLKLEEVAAVPLVFQTAWRALVTQAGLRPGEDVLVLGASGGVGTAALQIAKLAGARVFAVTSSPDKMERSRELGADLVFDRTEGDVWPRIAEATNGRGVDVVLDGVGAAVWTQALQSLVKGGRLVTFGRTSGRMGETDIRLVFWNQLRILGSTMASRREFHDVMRLVFQGRLRPVLDTVIPFERAREAYERLHRGDQFGKVVLRIP